LARTYRLLQILDGLNFNTVLDVGGGEGYLSALIRDLFGASTVHASDLSVEACLRAREIFEIPGLVADAATLPVADGSYDLVVCSEVIEHLSTPVLTIAELLRVARRFVVISTAEFCPTGELERWLRRRTLDRDYAHTELNWFTATDFRMLMGAHVKMCSQFKSVGHLVADHHFSREEMANALRFLTATRTLDLDHAGVVIVLSKAGDSVEITHTTSPERDRQVMERLLEGSSRPRTREESTAPDQQLLHRLACPSCRRATLQCQKEGLACVCGATYDVVKGIPILLTHETSSPINEVPHEVMNRLAGSSLHRARQIRKLAKKLHCGDLRHNSALTQRIAAVALRVLWLCCRKEPLKAKVERIVSRLVRRRPSDHEQLQTLLVALDAPPHG
jgi:ubiquinone/menaquinone biosynthesis C-methylase UbiE/uncharacterized protein YbaR (Trm112 family)